MASRSEALQTQMRKNPRGVFRVFFFVLIWTLALANVVIVAGEFQRSLPFVIGLGPPRRRGIEDSRRQAFPVITASCIILLIGIPIAVGLPLFGVALFFSLYIVEALWTGLVIILTLAGAASLSPQPTSPSLPTVLQYDLSVVLALSFIIVIFLSLYNIILLLRVSFLMGKSGHNPTHFTVSSLLNPPADQSTVKEDAPEPNAQPQNLTPEEMAQVDKRIENGSVRTLSSGWDEDDEDEKGKKAGESQGAFARAKSILIPSK